MQESCMLGLENAETMDAEAEAQVLQALLSKEVARGLKEGAAQKGTKSLQDPGLWIPRSRGR